MLRLLNRLNLKVFSSNSFSALIEIYRMLRLLNRLKVKGFEGVQFKTPPVIFLVPLYRDLELEQKTENWDALLFPANIFLLLAFCKHIASLCMRIRIQILELDS